MLLREGPKGSNQVCVVPLAQWIARWTSNPKVLGSTPRWDEDIFLQEWFGGQGASVVVALPSGFLSVAVITCASHAQGRRFEPGWKQTYFSSFASLPFVADVDDTH